MIIIMKMNASENDLDAVITRVTKEGFKTHISKGEEVTIVGVIGDERRLDQGAISRMTGVDRVVPVLRPFKLASRDFQPEDTKITINGHVIGGDKIIVMAGPCSVESLDQVMETANVVKEAGAHLLRGGAFKPRTSPYEFQGLGLKGLKLLAKARKVELSGATLALSGLTPRRDDSFGPHPRSGCRRRTTRSGCDRTAARGHQAPQ